MKLSIKMRECFLLIALFFNLSMSARAEGKPDTLSFIHMSDPHFCNLTPYHPFFVEKRQHYGQVAEPLKNFFRTVPGITQSEFVVITGDNVDFYEAESVTGEMLDTQIEQYIEQISISDVPVYLTLGNHDLASYRVDSDSTYISNQLHAVKSLSTWIRNAPCFRNGTYYSRTYMVDGITYRLIFLDNGYSNPMRSPGGTSFIMDAFQLLWLDNELKKSDTDIEILFTHIPLLRGNPDSDTVEIQEPVNPAITDFADLISVLRNNPSVRLILTGHGHNDVIHYYSFPEQYVLTEIMTPAFGRDPNNWRIVRLTGKSILVSSPGEQKTQYSIHLR